MTKPGNFFDCSEPIWDEKRGHASCALRKFTSSKVMMSERVLMTSLYLLSRQGVVTAASSLIHDLASTSTDDYKMAVQYSVSRLSRVGLSII